MVKLPEAEARMLRERSGGRVERAVSGEQRTCERVSI